MKRLILIVSFIFIIMSLKFIKFYLNLFEKLIVKSRGIHVESILTLFMNYV